mmetsp:Transcript_41120/g.113331  ORF Transcript_41120/g.113331 Transcript_41120/m.113331 type:complete len:215 (+) Transcript_41120:423-1067(+)
MVPAALCAKKLLGQGLPGKQLFLGLPLLPELAVFLLQQLALLVQLLLHLCELRSLRGKAVLLEDNLLLLRAELPLPTLRLSFLGAYRLLQGKLKLALCFDGRLHLPLALPHHCIELLPDFRHLCQVLLTEPGCLCREIFGLTLLLLAIQLLQSRAVASHPLRLLLPAGALLRLLSLTALESGLVGRESLGLGLQGRSALPSTALETRSMPRKTY